MANIQDIERRGLLQDQESSLIKIAIALHNRRIGRVDFKLRPETDFLSRE